MPGIPLAPQPGTITAILVGQVADHKKAESMARAALACPYTALYEIKGDTIIGIFTLPKNEREWIEYPQERPLFLRMDKVITTLITDCVQADSPWSRSLFQEPAQAGESEPRVDLCARYPDKCRGCPATLFYLAAD
jgi:hypothetical protein